MPRELFGDVSDPSVRVGSRKWYTVPVSLLVHTCVLLVVVVIPLVATNTLPDPRAITAWVVPPPIPPGPPPVRREPPPDRPIPDRHAAPIEAPPAIGLEPPEPLEPDITFPDGGIVGGLEKEVTPPPPPPPPPAPKAQEPVRPGGQIRAPERLGYVAPVYPVVAREARIQGVVIIEAIIGADGRVTNARVLRSLPFLDEAALAAVRQWTYKATTLNGVPVPVIMTVTVNFQLQ